MPLQGPCYIPQFVSPRARKSSMHARGDETASGRPSSWKRRPFVVPAYHKTSHVVYKNSARPRRDSQEEGDKELNKKPWARTWTTLIYANRTLTLEVRPKRYNDCSRSWILNPVSALETGFLRSKTRFPRQKPG